jgi:hypothetical protein
MSRILKEEKYPNALLKSRKPKFHGQPGKWMILEEYWYPIEVDPLNFDARQLNGQRWYKWNFVNGQKHGLQEGWYPSGVDPSDSVAYRRGDQHGYQKYYLDGIEVSQQDCQAYIRG